MPDSGAACRQRGGAERLARRPEEEEGKGRGGAAALGWPRDAAAATSLLGACQPGNLIRSRKLSACLSRRRRAPASAVCPGAGGNFWHFSGGDLGLPRAGGRRQRSPGGAGCRRPAREENFPRGARGGERAPGARCAPSEVGGAWRPDVRRGRPAARRDEAEPAVHGVRQRGLLRGDLLSLPDAGPGPLRPPEEPAAGGHLPQGPAFNIARKNRPFRTLVGRK